MRFFLSLTLLVMAIPLGVVRGDFLFQNTTAISIPDRGLANPYPSSIAVSGITQPVRDITLRLTGFSHTSTDDVAVVVVSPVGTVVKLFSGAGALLNRATNLVLNFNDAAAFKLPEEGTFGSGTYKPGCDQWDDNFPAPGPGLLEFTKQNYEIDFRKVITENPNGNWNLFIVDSAPGDAGSVSGGWSMNFSVTAVPEPGSMALIGCAVVGMFGVRRWRRR